MSELELSRTNEDLVEDEWEIEVNKCLKQEKVELV